MGFDIKAIILMVISQVGSGGVNVFYKLATADGMSVRVIVTYRLFFATAFMAPLAFLLESIEYLACVRLRFENFFMEKEKILEKLALGTWAGKAKVLGTVLGIGGAMVLTLYKGLEVKIGSPHTNLLHHQHHDVAASQRAMANPFLGSLLGVTGCFAFSTWLVIQTRISKTYPSYSSTALMCFMGTIQAFVFATCTEKDRSAWKLGWNIRLLAVAYAGIVSSGLVNAATSWVAWMKGPLFVSSFYPLGLIFVAFVGALFLDEKLHLGSLIGLVLIIGGLYAVLWGKRKEVIMGESPAASKNSRECAIETAHCDGNQPPLLPSPTNTTTNNNSVNITSAGRPIEDA
ncbi:hypothetical protein LguiB_032541 [Lonicera macranthoides]